MKRAQRRKFHYIYRITNKLNGKFYIGMHSTDNMDDGYFGSGKRLGYSVVKHGKENHEMEILEHYFSREELAAREKELVNKELLQNETCMNISLGGEGGGNWANAVFDVHARNAKCREKFKQKLSADSEFKQKFQSIANENLLSIESQSKARETKIEKFGNPVCPNVWGIGSQHSEESKIKIGLKMKEKSSGEKNSQFGTCWICNGVEAKKVKKEDLQLWLDKGWRKGRK